jgi:hypothetical protein
VSTGRRVLSSELLFCNDNYARQCQVSAMTCELFINVCIATLSSRNQLIAMRGAEAVDVTVNALWQTFVFGLLALLLGCFVLNDLTNVAVFCVMEHTMI